MSLSDQIATLEDPIKSMDHNIEVAVILKIHDDAPMGFVRSASTFSGQEEKYTKIIASEDGIPTKSIHLFIPN